MNAQILYDRTPRPDFSDLLPPGQTASFAWRGDASCCGGDCTGDCAGGSGAGCSCDGPSHTPPAPGMPRTAKPYGDGCCGSKGAKYGNEMIVATGWNEARHFAMEPLLNGGLGMSRWPSPEAGNVSNGPTGVLFDDSGGGFGQWTANTGTSPTGPNHLVTPVEETECTRWWGLSNENGLATLSYDECPDRAAEIAEYWPQCGESLPCLTGVRHWRSDRRPAREALLDHNVVIDEAMYSRSVGYDLVGLVEAGLTMLYSGRSPQPFRYKSQVAQLHEYAGCLWYLGGLDAARIDAEALDRFLDNASPHRRLTIQVTDHLDPRYDVPANGFPPWTKRWNWSPDPMVSIQYATAVMTHLGNLWTHGDAAGKSCAAARMATILYHEVLHLLIPEGHGDYPHICQSLIWAHTAAAYGFFGSAGRAIQSSCCPRVYPGWALPAERGSVLDPSCLPT